jgi:DNA-binding transcriptional MerR regulator
LTIPQGFGLLFKQEVIIVFVKEVCKATKLTKKAIEYYISQGMISPKISENTYRDFCQDDIETLKKISILRKLDLGIDDIKKVLSCEMNQVLQKLSTQKKLKFEREKTKQLLLDKLCSGTNWADIEIELVAIEQNETIAEKLLYSFPGYYGCFISFHFSRFLNELIKTVEQQEAYQEILNFLDNIPTIGFPKDAQEFFIENTKNISAQQIIDIDENTKQAIANPEKFLSENKEKLTEYLEYMQSDEYRNSPAYRMKCVLKDFNNISGYYKIFIPAMKKLSSSYKEYCMQAEIANEKFLEVYPDAKKLDE